MPIKEERRKRANPLEELVNSAVNEAVTVMAKENPFTEEFIRNYIDPKALNKYAEKVAEYIKEKKVTPQKAYELLASHMVSGDILTDEGKEIILNYSLRKKAKSGSGKAREILEGQKYLNQARVALKDLYNLIKSDRRYSERMPELTEAVESLEDLGMMDAAVSTLYKVLPKDKYMALKQGINKAGMNAEKNVGGVLNNYFSNIERYATAAIVLGLVGIGVIVASLAASNTLTGNVVGITNTKTIPAIVFGILSLIFGIYLGINKKVKKKYTWKKINKKRKK